MSSIGNLNLRVRDILIVGDENAGDILNATGDE